MKLLKFFGGILSFCLSCLFLIILFCFTTIIFAKNCVKQETLYNYMVKTDVLSIPVTGDIGNEYENGATLNTIITKELEKYNLSSSIITETKDELYKVVSSTTENYVEYVLGDKEKPIITENDIYQIISAEKIEKAANKTLTNVEKQEINSFIKSTVKEINNELPNKEEIFTNYDKLKNFAEFVYSQRFIYYLVGLIVITFLLIALFRWSLYKPFKWLGISTIIFSVMLILLYIAQLVIFKYFVNLRGIAESAIVKFVGVVSFDVLITGAIILGTGIVMLIIHKVIDRIRNKEEDFLAEEPLKPINQEKDI